MLKKRKVSIIGTHGVPAKYGGFETLADFLCQYLGTKIDLTVYCNAGIYSVKRKKYFGAKLKYLHLNASGFEGIFYDLITYVHALFYSDVILYLSPVGSGFIIPLKFFFHTKVIVNHGGLNEWDRPKLNSFQKRWAKFNHKVAAQVAEINIADNFNYRISLKNYFGAESEVIRYGGDHTKFIERSDSRFAEKYMFLPEVYAISVSRAQVDNNIHIVLETFESFDDYPVVIVSNWSVSDYGRDLKQKYYGHKNMFLLDAIYDKDELDYLRGNALCYIHSHSFCGTAPSLVEAMHLGKAVFAFDVPTNRETTHNQAMYFSNAQDLTKLLKSCSGDCLLSIAREMKNIAMNEYTWEKVTSQYKSLIESV
jgi:glycosyltransferase involved in cell wall biosynthesis